MAVTSKRQAPKGGRQRENWHRSQQLRAERSLIHKHVAKNGGSLALLIRERREALDGVEVIRLVRWLPNVGEAKAQRMTLGLPTRYRVGMLTSPQRAQLAARVAAFENRAHQRSGVIPHQEA